MLTEFRTVIEAVGIVIDAAGVLAIVVGLLVAAVRYATTGRARAPTAFACCGRTWGAASCWGWRS